jgi:hypothetical protein
MQGIVISELIESYVPYLLNCNFWSMPIQFLKLKTKANLKRIDSKDALHFLWFQMKDDDLRRKFYKKKFELSNEHETIIEDVMVQNRQAIILCLYVRAGL